MARSGVNYIDVTKAAEAIRALGQEPTVDRVREYLGTGSKSTIAPLLKRWRSNNADGADTEGLPEDLVVAMKSLYERVQLLADARIEQASEEFAAQNRQIKQELVEAHNAILQFSTRQKELEEQIAQLTDFKNHQEQSLHDARVALAKAEFQRDDVLSRVADLKDVVAELRQENRTIRDHFEHFQQRTAEDRHLEREQHRQANQLLHDQLQFLKNQLASAEGRAADLNESNAQLRARAQELEQIQVTLDSELNKVRETANELKRDLKYAQSRNQKYELQTGQLTDQIASLSKLKTEQEKEIALTSQALNVAQAELKKTKEQAFLLAGENKEILQEKSVIQGQLKQLQGSL